MSPPLPPPDTDPSNMEWYAVVTKFGAAALTSVAATMAKISNEILNGRKLTWLQWFAIVSISLFWSVMSGVFCLWRHFDPILTSIIVGLCTLLGEKINIYMSKNYKVIFDRILAIFQTRKE